MDEDNSPPNKRPRTAEQEEQSDTSDFSDDDQMEKESDGDESDDAPKKVFNDSVHGHIELHPLLVSIIDTTEFQRLRFIKQLGMCYFVYPGATHNRFEHSVGVCYLAGELVRSLQREQPDLGITKKDVLCVEIAGLCHDLGHGPFSHLFDNIFIPRVKEDCPGESDMETTEERIVGDKQEHEERSVAMFKHLLKKNKHLKRRFKKYGLEKIDRTFIKEQIVGTEEKVRKGRTERTFLYDIVANKRNGIDVDKWDYFARDSLYLGIGNSFDWGRFLKFARVLPVGDGPGVNQICTRDKEIHNLYDMFHTRYMIHKRACKHRVTQILEEMMAEALKEANEHLRFPGTAGKDGKEPKKLMMSQAIDDMEAFSKMTDNVMWTIFASTEENLKKSKDILIRIMERDLFPYVGETRLTEKLTEELTEELTKRSEGTPKSTAIQIIKDRWRGEIHDLLDEEAQQEIKKTDIIIQIASFSYDMGEKDPIKYVNFYRKSQTGSKPVVIRGGELLDKDPMALPLEFSVKFVRVCLRNKQKQVKQVLGLVHGAFQKWCEETKSAAKPIGDPVPCIPPKPAEEPGPSSQEAPQ